MRWAVCLLAIGLAACSGSPWPSGSVVAVSPADAKVLAVDINGYLVSTLPRQSVVDIELANPDPIAFVLIPLLDEDGFTRSQSGHHVKYVADKFGEKSIFLRVSVDNAQGASRLFVRSTDGVLQPAGPLTVAAQ
jgi:hypothetical protein